MKNWSHLKEGVRIMLIISVMVGLGGCYTMLRHPTVAQEELVSGSDQELTGATCTDCHNNEYDHHRMSPHYWGFGSWGVRTYPYGYYGGYIGWQRYYYDPWWWGWNYYYDPYPYYPYYPPGGGIGGGSGTVSAPSPDRPMTRRGLNENLLPQAPPIPDPPTQPPVYLNPTPSPTPSGGQSGSQPQIAPAPAPPPPPPQQPQQNNNNNSGGRSGRRGGRG